MDVVNPLAPLLGPLQASLGGAVERLRTARRIAQWEDRYVTALLFGALWCAVLVLAQLVPWPLVLHWGTRAAGFAALGPHMFFVGKYLDKKRAAADALEKEYRAADNAGKRLMLEAVAAAAEADASKKLEKAKAAYATEPRVVLRPPVHSRPRATLTRCRPVPRCRHAKTRSKAQKLADAWLEEHAASMSTLINRPTRIPGRWRFRSLPILSRSTAYYPLPPTERPPLTALPGGYAPSERLYYTAKTKTFSDGDSLVHGKQGEVVGPATSDAVKGKGVIMMFEGNKEPIECLLDSLSRESPTK